MHQMHKCSRFWFTGWYEEHYLKMCLHYQIHQQMHQRQSLKSGKKNARQYQWRPKNIKYLNENTVCFHRFPSKWWLWMFRSSDELFQDVLWWEYAWPHHFTKKHIQQPMQHKQRCYIGIDKADLERKLGIIINYMSVISAPYYWFYWELETCYELIASAMSHDWFESLKRFLHFNDSTKDKRDDKTRDRLFKICPLSEMLRQNCLSQKPEEHNSIDEQIVPFKGRSFLWRYCKTGWLGPLGWLGPNLKTTFIPQIYQFFLYLVVKDLKKTPDFLSIKSQIWFNT